MNPPIPLTPSNAWASGNRLIVGHSAVLPPFCVKCGRPAEPPTVKRSFRWHPQWVYIFILLALLLYAILAMVLGRTMAVNLPLCRQHREKYRALGWAGLILTLGAIPEMVLAAAYLPESAQVYGFVAGGLAVVAGLTCYILWSSILRAHEINAKYANFSGADPAFLQYLPPTTPGVVYFK
ncbi:MAG TPA: hypothetical protein VMT51_08805 [Dongiaceae bacterium]|nr:hypothetical protein [Dongiaceae bacterium]